jgi:hypothetical protein
MTNTIRTQAVELPSKHLAAAINRLVFPTNVRGSAIRVGLVAGLAGGLAEVVWIGLYSAVTSSSGFGIAAQVADTVFPGVLQMPFAPGLGLVIHFGLSIALGLLLGLPLIAFAQRKMSALLPVCLGLFGLIWVMNFMLVLPVLNPIFPTLLPFWVTLFSKLLFGSTLAGVLAMAAPARRQPLRN